MSSLKEFAKALRRLPQVVAIEAAERAAPEITKTARETFDAGEDSYGVPWSPGAEGQRVSLVKTGALSRFIRYVAVGAKLRVSLGVDYAKYQIGKRPVFPSQGGVLPARYIEALRESVASVISEELKR